MSRQQKLDLHDSLHEGRAPQVRMAAKVEVRGTYPTVSKSSGYGSTGSKVSYGSTGSSAGYGSVGSLQVGSYFNGGIVVAISEPRTVVAPTAVEEQKVERPVAAPVKASCPCGVDCKCGPNCDCNENKKQVFIRKEDFEQMPLI
jgi:hypothetical protein